MSKKNELPIPDPASNDSQSFELLRVWVANKGQHVTMQSDVWDDPAAWGIMLADLARHIANSYHLDKKMDSAQVLERIKAGFDVEMASPTDR